MVIRHHNRANSASKGKRFWCPYCDACIVGEIGKCKVCGRNYARKEGKKKIPSINIELEN